MAGRIEGQQMNDQRIDDQRIRVYREITVRGLWWPTRFEQC
jgi:hypothetical protein